MAGELVEFHGRSAWFACGACPRELRGLSISLKSSDGGIFPMKAEELALSRGAMRLAKPDATITVPLKKVVLAEVAKYLKYHANKETPPSEIRTPLVDDNLVNSGASRWDKNFMNMDKEMLFDLMVAANVMDIPSLLLLTAAKASLIVQGKPSVRLLQDFQMSNDLPDSERDALFESFEKAKEPQGVDGSELGGVALVLNGVCQAAEKAGVLAPESGDMPGPAVGSLESYRLASWRAMVLADWKQLEQAPPEVVGDRGVLSAAIDASCGTALKFASAELKKDKRLVLQAVKLNAKSLEYADDSLRSNRAFVVEAVALQGGALQFAARGFQSDRALLQGACDVGNGQALMHAAAELQNDWEFMMDCAKRDPKAILYATERLMDDKVFALNVANRNGVTLKHMLPKFQADLDVVSVAIQSDPTAVRYAHTSVRAKLKEEQPQGCHTGQDSAPVLAALKKEQDEAQAEEERVEKCVSPFKHSAILSAQDLAANRNRVPKSAKTHSVSKIIHFSALQTIKTNLGQANYTAANSFLDKLPFYARPEVDAMTLQWGAVGYIGMRLKAFASADMMLANPEALMSIDESHKVLNAVLGVIGKPEKEPIITVPETLAVACLDEITRENFLVQTYGKHKSRGFWSGEDALSVSSRSQPQDGKMERRTPRVADSSPLSGWPELNGQGAGEPGQQGLLRTGANMQPPLVPIAGLELEVGGKVLFQGVQAKSGVTGTLLQRFSNGRWKVSMDDGTGNAILKAEYLVALAPGMA